MNVTYSLADDRKVSVSLWSCMLKGVPPIPCAKLLYHEVDTNSVTCGPEKPVRVYQDDDGKLFLDFEGQQKQVDDFDYLPVEKLIEKIEKGEYVEDDELYATLYKDTDRVGFHLQLSTYLPAAKILFGLEIATPCSPTIECLCIPTEKRWEKSNWGYMLTLEASDDSLQKMCSPQDINLGDLCNIINAQGHIKLASR